METALFFTSLEKHVRLAETQKQFLSGILRERKLKKGQFLVHEGSVQRASCFVVKGLLHAYHVATDGKEHSILFAAEGWWISDLNSFTRQVPAIFNIQALEDSMVLELPFDQTEAMFAQVPQMERYFRIITERAFFSFQLRIVQNNSLGAKDRYLQFREKYAALLLRLPQKLVASYLGMTPEFLSKIKSEGRADSSSHEDQ